MVIIEIVLEDKKKILEIEFNSMRYYNTAG